MIQYLSLAAFLVLTSEVNAAFNTPCNYTLNENKPITKSVTGNQLEQCGCDPVTGYFRDGFCNTDDSDHGSHIVCATLTSEFLDFTKS